MNKCYAVSVFGVLLVGLCLRATGQKVNRPSDRLVYREKAIQFSSFPGISTGGLESGKYTYRFSFNLLSGITAGTKYFAFATISNLGTRSSSGIQFAGLANIIGTQSYLHLTNAEINQLEQEDLIPGQKGIQLAGVLNYVRGVSSGAQVTAGMNAAFKGGSGIHLAGIGNFAGGDMIGVQISGIYNVTERLTLGTQIGAMNVAGTRLSGVQLGLINHVELVEGKANNASYHTFGLQLGLINYAVTNNGFQIGLINRAKRMRGVQVGLINLFSSAPYDGANRYNGVPIGLLNLGSTDSHIRFSRSDLLPWMAEYTTGNCHNCTFTESKMPISDIFYKTNQNALIVGYSFSDDEQVKWAVGYGFHRMYYIKSSMSKADPGNKKYFFSPSIRIMHLNQQKKFDSSLSLLSQLQLDAGYRLKWFAIYVGIHLNAYWYQDQLPLEVNWELLNRSSFVNHQLWFGYTFGIQL
ncbi:MAG: hypothetical protein AAF600_20010 [Bacteroidota bacterium]